MIDPVETLLNAARLAFLRDDVEATRAALRAAVFALIVPEKCVLEHPLEMIEEAIAAFAIDEEAEEKPEPDEAEEEAAAAAWLPDLLLEIGRALNALDRPGWSEEALRANPKLAAGLRRDEAQIRARSRARSAR